jgi:hypothetical protein
MELSYESIPFRDGGTVFVPSPASGSCCQRPVPLPGILTMDSTLADLFQTSRGDPVEWDGRTVHMMYELVGPAADQRLLIRFRQRSPARAQALRIRARGGLVELNGQVLDDVVLWSESAPKAGKPMTVRIWNAWRDPAGTMHAWIGNSGMLIEEPGDGSTVLRCSDGFDDPAFDDLVVVLTLSSK